MEDICLNLMVNCWWKSKNVLFSLFFCVNEVEGVNWKKEEKVVFLPAQIRLFLNAYKKKMEITESIPSSFLSYSMT